MATIKNSKSAALTPQELGSRFPEVKGKGFQRIEWQGDCALVRDPDVQSQAWWVNYAGTPKVARALKTHDRIVRGRDWSTMIAEPSARERMERENPAAVELLDFFVERTRSLDGIGWTTFNDWLDICYEKKLPEKSGLPFIPVDHIRVLAFPACRTENERRGR